MFATILMGMLLIGIIVGVVMIPRANLAFIGICTAATCTLILLVMAFFTMTYSQDPGQAKVLRSFTGRVVSTDTTDGLGFKMPWVSAIDYNMRNQVVSYVGDGTDQTGPAIPAQDKDGATATMDVVVRYSIDPGGIESIYNEFGSQESLEAKLVQNDARAVIRNIPLKYPTATFRLNREQAAMEMQKALADRWKNRSIRVDQVDLRDIRYPDNIEKSLQAVQEATNNANKAKADLETAKVTAEKTRVEAQAQADYDQIVRCGATHTTEKAEINGQQTTITKVVPLTGNSCQNRLNDQVLTNKYIDALREMAAKGNLIVVPQGFNGVLNMPSTQGK